MYVCMHICKCIASCLVNPTMYTGSVIWIIITSSLLLGSFWLVLEEKKQKLICAKRVVPWN